MRTPDGPSQRLRVVLVAHLRGRVRLLELARGVAPVRARASRTFRPEPKPRVGLDADEVVLARQLEEPVVDLRLELERARARLGPVLVLDVGHGQRDPGRHSGVGADRRRPEAVSLEQVVDRALGTVPVVGVARRVDAEQPAARTEALRLVQGAGVSHPVSQRVRRPGAVPLEPPRELVSREAACLVDPHGVGEVVEGHDRRDAVLVACVQEPAVVHQLGVRELALGRLDPRPLDPETKAVQAGGRNHRDVVAVPMVEVACVAGRLAAGRGLEMLPPPPVRIHVVALGLVRRDRRAEQEAVREVQCISHPAESRDVGQRQVDNPSGANYYPAVSQRERSPWHAENGPRGAQQGIWRREHSCPTS